MAHLIDSNATLWHNVRALMMKKYGKVNMKGFAADCDVGIATIQRIKAQKTSVGLAVIDKIADKFELAAWQLLVPGFDPKNPPALQPVSAQEKKLYDKIMSAVEAITSEPEVEQYLKSSQQEGKP